MGPSPLALWWLFTVTAISIYHRGRLHLYSGAKAVAEGGVLTPVLADALIVSQDPLEVTLEWSEIGSIRCVQRSSGWLAHILLL